MSFYNHGAYGQGNSNDNQASVSLAELCDFECFSVLGPFEFRSHGRGSPPFETERKQEILILQSRSFPVARIHRDLESLRSKLVSMLKAPTKYVAPPLLKNCTGSCRIFETHPAALYSGPRQGHHSMGYPYPDSCLMCFLGYTAPL